MTKFKLLKKDNLATKERNYWNSCPLKKEYLPENHCPEGIPEKSKDNRIIKEAHCAWWINSPEHNYCFWKFVYDRSNSDGSMKELVQSDLSKLFGWSSSKTNTMIAEALENFIKALKKHELIGADYNVDEHFDLHDINQIMQNNDGDY